MCRLERVLFEKLQHGGLDPETIPLFLKCLHTFLSADPPLTLVQINQKLDYVGWKGVTIDYHTHQLAASWFETRMTPLWEEHRLD